MAFPPREVRMELIHGAIGASLADVVDPPGGDEDSQPLALGVGREQPAAGAAATDPSPHDPLGIAHDSVGRKGGRNETLYLRGARGHARSPRLPPLATG